MADYSYSSVALWKFIREFDENRSAVRSWMELADAIGPMLLPFVVKTETYPTIPFAAIGIKPTPLSTLCPRRGEMWILFCFRKNVFGEGDSPIRSDGFALVLEWRKGRSDSPLLASSFHRLANDVRRQLSITGWGLYPSFDRYGDRISFTDPELFSDAEHIDNVTSAWGALAAGLHCANADEYPSQWPFPSVQWDERTKSVMGVAGLQEKVSVARDCGATSIVVEKKQATMVNRFVRKLAGEGGQILVHGVNQCANARKLASMLAFGVERRRRKIRIAVLSSLVTLCIVVGSFVLQGYLARRKIEKSAFEGAVRWLDSDSAKKPSGSELWHSWRVLRDLAENIDVRQYLVEQLASRDWILPIDVVPSAESTTAFYRSELRCISVDIGKKEQPLCAKSTGASPLRMKQIWIPDGFPLRYALLHSDVAAFEASGTNALKFVTDFSKPRYLKDVVASGLTALRISPDGSLGVAEAANPSPELLAFNAFYGDQLWRVPSPAPVSAFAFGNSCDRLAFGTTNGIVRILSSTGMNIGQEMRFGRKIEALRFEPGDDALHVLVNGNDITCAIVVQDHENSIQLPDVFGSADTARAFLDLVEPESDVSKTDIARLRTAKDAFGAFMRYALTPCEKRTINVFSDMEYGAWAEKLLKQGKPCDLLRIFAMNPDDARATMHNWFSNAESLARLHAMGRLGCSDYIDPKLLDIHFYDDPQVMWSSDYMFRYTLAQHPESEKAKDLCERIFLRESGRLQLRVPTFFSEPQAESDFAVRKLYLSLCELRQMIFHCDKTRREAEFCREETTRRFSPTPSDDAIDLWGKMLRNLKCGTDAGALACFEAFVERNSPDELRISEYAPAVRTYIRERKRLGLEGGVLVMGYEAPATDHPNLKVGDIIIEVNGVCCRNDKDYDQALKNRVGCQPLLVLLRLNSITSEFEKLSLELAKGPRFGRRSLSEK